MLWVVDERWWMRDEMVMGGRDVMVCGVGDLNSCSLLLDFLFVMVDNLGEGFGGIVECGD